MTNDEVVAYRNKFVFRAVLVISIFILISMVLSHKPLFFIGAYLLVITAFHSLNGYLLYQKDPTSSLSPYLYVLGFYGVWLLLFLSDPSLNKFLFLFAAFLLPTIYQNKRLIYFSSSLGVVIYIILYVRYGDAIYSGYDIVEFKSFVFTMTILLILFLLLVAQTSSTEQVRRMVEERAEEARENENAAKKLLSSLEQNATFLEGFSDELQMGTEETKEKTERVTEYVRTLKTNMTSQNEAVFQTNDNVENVKREGGAILSSLEEMVKTNDSSASVVEEASRQMVSLQDNLSKLRDIFTSSLSAASKLTSRGTSIAKNIQAIQDVANKTNLLALNATIEAAHAGAQGQGFMVVADEVKNLSHLTQSLVHSISETLQAIISDANENERMMTSSHQAVEESLDTSANAQTAFSHLAHHTSTLSDEAEAIQKRMATFQQNLGDMERKMSLIYEKSAHNETTTAQLQQAFLEVHEQIASLAEQFQTLHQESQNSLN